MKEFALLGDFLEKKDDFILVGHKNADGDCIGTMCAFGIILEKLGKKARFLVADPIPYGYLFLKKTKDFLITQNYDCNFNPVILFECGTLERSGIKLENPGETVNFDHHPDNTYYGDINAVNPKASSVGEMAVEFFKNRYDNLLDKETANSLYAAIHTDTGGFSYSNVKKSTFDYCSYLCEKGLNIQEVCNEIYGNNPMNKTKLLGFYLQNLKLEQVKDFNVCYGVITLEDLKRFSCSARDTENFANYPRGIAKVEVGIFFLEIEPGVFKVSLRSKGKVAVNGVAQAFKGGGHKFAAGCTVKGDFSGILKDLLSRISENE